MMKNRFVIIAISLIATFVFAACSSDEIGSSVHRRISQEEAVEMMADQDQDVIVLDVRETSEFDLGHIPDAVSLPLGEILSTVELMIPDKEQVILVYCQTGNRSNTAAALLSDIGYSNVYDFGGIVSWQGDINR